MKKLLLSLTACLAAITAQAITVTYNDQKVENDAVITVAKDAFTITDMGVIVIYDATCNFKVTDYTGTYDLKVVTSSDPEPVQVCAEGEECYSYSKEGDDYVINATPNVDFHFQCSGTGDSIPTIEKTFEVTIGDGTEAITFKVVYDTNLDESSMSSGVGRIEADGTNTPVNVYTLDGRKVLEKVMPAEASRLAPGLYIVGGKKMIIR